MSAEIDVQTDDAVLKEAIDAIDGRPDLIGSIDQGTSSTRFLVFTQFGRIAASAQMEHKQIFPSGHDKVGWHEHDPMEIWQNTVKCILAVSEALRKYDIDLEQTPLKGIGITNQRETTIAWNAETGIVYYNAIVWDDTRTTAIASSFGGKNLFRDKTGLPLASYFAGTKVKWLLDNVPRLQQDLTDQAQRKNVRFGTVDTWLLYQLTGSKSESLRGANTGGLFITDVTNASRWLFLNIHAMRWDQFLIDTICAPHSLPLSALPTIQSSSQVYALCKRANGVPCLRNVPIAAILGDQQAALFGQCAFSPGEAKCTYGTGLFLMMNTGTKAVPSTQGLLTTVGYQLGSKGEVRYALEGSVSHSGSTIQWLRDQLGIIKNAPESEIFAAKTKGNDGLYFVPAFAGLFAPHWRSDARACIVGMTATHTKNHICRAALEAAAYQAREVFDAIYADSNVKLKELKVDGGACANTLLMQFQSDMIDAPVVKPLTLETTARGAAFAAGLAVGVWKNLDELKKMWGVSKAFKPNMSPQERETNWKGWQKAVSKSMGWMDENGDEEELTRRPGYSKISLGVTALLALAVGFIIGGRPRK